MKSFLAPLLLCFVATTLLQSAPPAMVAQTQGVTLTIPGNITFPPGGALLQYFTSADRATTAPWSLTTLGYQTDTGTFYAATGTSAGNWSASSFGISESDFNAGLATRATVDTPTFTGTVTMDDFQSDTGLVASDGSGTLQALFFSGDGSALTNLSASNLSSGTLAKARGGFGTDVSGSTGVPSFASGTLSFLTGVTNSTWGTTSGTTPALTFAAGTRKNITHTTSGDTTFSASGYAQGSEIELFITADATRALSFPGWTWMEGAPSTIANGKHMWIQLKCTSTTAGSVYAVYGVEQ